MKSIDAISIAIITLAIGAAVALSGPAEAATVNIDDTVEPPAIVVEVAESEENMFGGSKADTISKLCVTGIAKFEEVKGKELTNRQRRSVWEDCIKKSSDWI